MTPRILDCSREQNSSSSRFEKLSIKASHVRPQCQVPQGPSAPPEGGQHCLATFLGWQAVSSAHSGRGWSRYCRVRQLWSQTTEDAPLLGLRPDALRNVFGKCFLCSGQSKPVGSSRRMQGMGWFKEKGKDLEKVEVPTVGLHSVKRGCRSL